MSFSKLSTAVVALSGLALSDAAMCAKFSDVYEDGKAVMEGIWGEAFTYETDEANAYDLWFADASNNPNDALTQKLLAADAITDANAHLDANGLVDKCYLDYSHKNETEAIDNNVHPLSDPEDFTICLPWAERSCCKHDTVNEIAEFKKLFEEWYGAGGEVCGALSASCQEMFVQEECFYACSPNAGLFRQYKSEDAPVVQNSAQVFDEANANHDEWSMIGMPTKASFWDKFYNACKDDMVATASTADDDSAAHVSATASLAGAAVVTAFVLA